MPYRYPTEFRRRVLDPIASGTSVASIAGGHVDGAWAAAWLKE